MDARVRDVEIVEIEFQEPIDVFRPWRDSWYACLLTGRGMKDISRYSFIGLFPHTVVRYEGGRFSVEREAGAETIDGDFWGFLNRALARTNFESLPYPASLCGGVGYISYEALHAIEDIRKETKDNYSMPWIEWVFYNRYFVFDHQARKAFRIEMGYEEPSRIDRRDPAGETYSVADVAAECDAEEYKDKVRRIQEYILEGDIYEVNLSQQIRGSFRGSAFALFERLFSINDAPFSAWLNFGDVKVVCNSPEMFLRCHGRHVETRPIKGTIQRGDTAEEDADNQRKLLASEKDQAELFMIVDLLRNDIGKVCEYGSVRVEEAKRLEAFRNVHHLVGIVSGTLRQGTSYFDLLRATFPGGSITGCPKVRCIEIIEELETYSRNLYTGSVFMMNRDHFVSNIVIRSCVVKGGEIFLNSGGAVTIDSDPADEFRETVHKIRNLMESIGYDRFLR